jgi:indolepyruvate decarboxylase
MARNTAPMNVSLYIAQRLRELGVDTLFAVPGDYVTPFMDQVLAAKAIDMVPMPNEQIAGYAADGYARARGIGAFAVTYGVGSFSAVNAVAGSYVEHLPVIIINGSPSKAQRAQADLQGVLFHHATGNFGADRDVYANVTTEAIVIDDAATAPAKIDAALSAAISRSRPVYIEALKDVWAAQCAAPAGKIAREAFFCDEAALAEAVERTAEHLRRAKKPIVWTDVLIGRYHLTDEFEAFVRDTGLSFTTSLLGKSIVSEDLPGFVGTYDGPSAEPQTRRAVEEADCILGIGVIMTDDYAGVVGVDFTRMILGGASSVRVGYSTYANVPLERYLPALRARLRRDGPVAKLRRATRIEAPKTKPKDPISFEGFFFDRIQNFIDDDMILVADESNSMYVSGSLHVAKNQYYSQAAWGSIGYATPGSIGIAAANPKKRLVVFAGDGGFQQIAQALAPMARLKQPTIVFVMNNDIYGIEQALVDVTFFTQPPNAPKAYNVLDKWDYCALAKAFGCAAERAETFAELDDVLNKLKRSRETTLVHVVIPMRDLPWQIRIIGSDEPALPPIPPAKAKLLKADATRPHRSRVFALASIDPPAKK